MDVPHNEGTRLTVPYDMSEIHTGSGGSTAEVVQNEEADKSPKKAVEGRLFLFQNSPAQLALSETS